MLRTVFPLFSLVAACATPVGSTHPPSSTAPSSEAAPGTEVAPTDDRERAAVAVALARRPDSKVIRSVVRGDRAVVVLSKADALNFVSLEYLYEHRAGRERIAEGWILRNETYAAPIAAFREPGDANDDATLSRWIEAQLAERAISRLDLVRTHPDGSVSRQTVPMPPLREGPSSLPCPGGNSFGGVAEAIDVGVELQVCRHPDDTLTGRLALVEPSGGANAPFTGSHVAELGSDALVLTLAMAPAPNDGGFRTLGTLEIAKGRPLVLRHIARVASFSGGEEPLRVTMRGSLDLAEIAR